jgi:hypothetical protein
VISAERMRQLLLEHTARPLLPGHFPTPARYQDRWWHVPTAPEPGQAADDYVPASPGQAAQFDRLAARYRAAQAAIAAADRDRHPARPTP